MLTKVAAIIDGRFCALLGVAAMLAALLTAPIFHVHRQDDHSQNDDQDDDHGHHASLVHAHFPSDVEAEATEDHSGKEVELPHSQHRAQWIDVFTFSDAPQTFVLTVDLAEAVAVPQMEEREAAVISAIPQAHGPPGARRSAPRSPPSL